MSQQDNSSYHRATRIRTSTNFSREIFSQPWAQSSRRRRHRRQERQWVTAVMTQRADATLRVVTATVVATQKYKNVTLLTPQLDGCDGGDGGLRPERWKDTVRWAASWADSDLECCKPANPFVMNMLNRLVSADQFDCVSLPCLMITWSSLIRSLCPVQALLAHRHATISMAHSENQCLQSILDDLISPSISHPSPSILLICSKRQYCSVAHIRQCIRYGN
jgi:hypothetical protein